MRTFKALIWKEFQTLKFVWVAGLLLFYAFPFWPSLVRSGASVNRPSESVAGISICFGAVYCVILVISLVCRDFQQPLESFWRSRPIRITQVLLIKYTLGLITVIFIAFVPLLLASLWEGPSTRNLSKFQMLPDFQVHILLLHTFTLMAVLSLCFFVGAWVRKAVETALLSFAAILILYFFPVVFPPLESISIVNFINQWEASVGLFKPEVLVAAPGWNPLSLFNTHLNLGVFVFAFNQDWVIFVLSMVILSLVAFAAAVWVLNRGWSFSLDQKSIAWSLAAVSLLLFGAASFEVGTNLECERVIRSTQERSVQGIAQKDGRGVLVYQFDRGSGLDSSLHLGFQEFDLNREEVYGRSVEDPWVIGPGRVRYGNISFSWDHRSPHLVHYIARDVSRTYTDRSRWKEERKSLALATVNFETPSSATLIARVDLRPLMEKHPNRFEDSGFVPGMALVGEASLVLNLSFDTDLKFFDLRSPEHPKASGSPIKGFFGWSVPPGAYGEREMVEFTLPRIPGLSAEERLKALGDLLGSGGHAISPVIYAAQGRDYTIGIHRRVSLDEEKAVFEKVGDIVQSPVERLLQSGTRQIVLVDSYLIHVHSGGLTVYDLSDPSRPMRVGHYRSGIDSLNKVVPLGDGRILAAGNHLHVVRLPEKGRRGV